MNWFRTITRFYWVLALVLIAGCGGNVQTESPASTTDETTDMSEQIGTFAFRANGEDFIRQGFVSGDGWRIDFDHAYVTLANLTSYQSDPPFDSESDDAPQASVTVQLDGPYVVDLAEGDTDADPILVGTVDAPAGRYNALAWDMVAAPDGPAQGAVIMLQGTAEKDGETVDFTLRLTQEGAYLCGDFVGDERKGILTAGGNADVEATFHFDHLFGDATMPPDDAINTDALGFAPLAELAVDGQMDMDTAALENALSDEDAAKLRAVHLAHVGEGHCRTR
ncbi:MAG: DUF4382 domain-containing protein [Chloroflexaceae bacterium]|nr:DUF4382 domain-containing protein [Chloroflexaceae bacterium]